MSETQHSEEHSPTYLFAGGGTGGHLTPGLAVAARLRVEVPRCRIVFVGSDRPLEQQILQRHGVEQIALGAESSQGALRHPLRFLWRNWRAYRQAVRLLPEVRPDVVIGLGGFASVPLVYAACRRGYRTLLLEQNTIPGRANRLLSRWADHACLAFPESARWLATRCPTSVTGNPVREEIAALALSQRHPADLTGKSNSLLILGGSQGASGLNDAVRRMVQGSPEQWRDVRIVHQTGAADCPSMRETYARLGLSAVVEPFFHEMGPLYQQTTLAISRAGATTLAELACAGIPAVLVPYPHAARRHQLHNAEHYCRAGAALLVNQKDDPAQTAQELARTVRDVLSNPGRHSALGQAMRGEAHPAAAEEVVRVLQSLSPRPIT
ncbi:MAG: undecaprenyldiphospho-muramoylpentapeptide beta-N-acetylglucosaminyltransferase [Planctomycetales bacterium]